MSVEIWRVVTGRRRFLRVADIAVNTHGQSQVALVLSAPAKATNHLVAWWESDSRGMDASGTLFGSAVSSPPAGGEGHTIRAG